MTGLVLSPRIRILEHQVVPDERLDWYIQLLYGGRGLGKTFTGVRWLVKQAIRYPDTEWKAVGRTWGEAKRILANGPAGVRKFVESNGLEPALRGGSWTKAFVGSPGEMAVYFANGSTIQFASAEKPDSLRGGNACGAYCDEMFFWPSQSFDMLLLGTRMSPAPGIPARIVAGSTPDGENWAHERFVAAAPTPGVIFIGGGSLPPETPPSTFDNPFLDEGFVRTVRAMYEGTDMGEQELHGKFLSLKGGIYKALDLALHTRQGLAESETDFAWPESPDDCDEVVWGQDLGTEHPSADLVFARKGERWFCVAEVVTPSADEEQLWDNVAPLWERWRPERIYSESANPMTTNAQRRRGMPVLDVTKGPSSVMDGIREVQRHLHARTLLIDTEACPITWQQMRAYRWQMDADREKVLVPERPVKLNDDACDALRYWAHSIKALEKRDLLIAGGDPPEVVPDPWDDDNW